ncbi:MAG: type II toxin-antitoxin system RelE/ParE family toxin [Oscillochloridaceae bacterium umkhey_bin13]
MKWTILLDPEFEQWLTDQASGVQIAIAAHANLLSQRGPALGRPYVDTLKGSNLPNLKELRVQHGGVP